VNTRQHIRRDRERGSILIVVLLTTSALAVIAFAASRNSRGLLETAADERAQIHAEAVADSALAYANQQLAHDENWAGTSDWVDLDDDVFRVTPLPAPQPEDRHYLIETVADGAVVKLKAEFHVDRYQAPVLNHALATLGGDLRLNNVQIVGDVLSVDTLDGVKDYDPVSGEWFTRTSGEIPVVTANNNLVEGDLMTYSGELGGVTVTGDNQQMFAPIINPTWTLDSWLTPMPGRIVTTQTTFDHFDTEDTLVIVSSPGARIDLNQCDIKGGVVVWSPAEWPQRGDAYNEIAWNACNFGRPSAEPNSTNIGMIAPGSHLVDGNNESYGWGLFYFHEITRLNNAHFEGSLWVTNDFDLMRNCEVSYDPALANVTYEGMNASAIWTPLDGVSEYHAATP